MLTITTSGRMEKVSVEDDYKWTRGVGKESVVSLSLEDDYVLCVLS